MGREMSKSEISYMDAYYGHMVPIKVREWMDRCPLTMTSKLRKALAKSIRMDYPRYPVEFEFDTYDCWGARWNYGDVCADNDQAVYDGLEMMIEQEANNE